MKHSYRQSVTGKMAKRTELRRTRRGQRIDRRKLFSQRNHRQKRFSNRRHTKLPPSVLSNRQMELRILNEMAAILPISEIRDEACLSHQCFLLLPLNPPKLTSKTQGWLEQTKLASLKEMLMGAMRKRLKLGSG